MPPLGWFTGTIHRARPDVRVVLHAHTPYATALSTLQGPAAFAPGQQHRAVLAIWGSTTLRICR